ncbi:minor capsid protein [Rhodococcus opacus]|uniref:minor capsid protein n=1 Tax=Rhodococcus opacus TaxID=37919 RepID=UPI001C460C4F|nr:minor capsid protein [Rhodococcus opacus]MBV6758356.1 minor capsid protein [Rhodococcus opacus]
MTAHTPGDVREAIAAYLDAHGIAKYEPDDAYPDDLELPAVFFGAMPEAPDRAVTVNVYDWVTTRDKANPDVFVQLRFRGTADMAAADLPADQAFALLDEAEHYAMGDVRVLQSIRRVTTSAALDTNGRYERPESYRFTIHPKGTA